MTATIHDIKIARDNREFREMCEEIDQRGDSRRDRLVALALGLVDAIEEGVVENWDTTQLKGMEAMMQGWSEGFPTGLVKQDG